MPNSASVETAGSSTTEDWHGGGLLTHVRQIGDATRAIADAHREYMRTIPQMQGRNIRVALDEWNYWYGPHVFSELGTRYFLRAALGIAAGINEYSRQTDVIAMANDAQTVNVIAAIKTSKTAAVPDSTGEALVMYRRHFGTIPVRMTGAPEPLDVAATWTAGGASAPSAPARTPYRPHHPAPQPEPSMSGCAYRRLINQIRKKGKGASVPRTALWHPSYSEMQLSRGAGQLLQRPSSVPSRRLEPQST